MESALRTEIQKWRGDAEAAERKLRSSQDEHKNISNKLKQIQAELE
jgi:predicted  nucleic acid-binding Zn-ribbon protein